MDKFMKHMNSRIYFKSIQCEFIIFLSLWLLVILRSLLMYSLVPKCRLVPLVPCMWQLSVCEREYVLEGLHLFLWVCSGIF